MVGFAAFDRLEAPEFLDIEKVDGVAMVSSRVMVSFFGNVLRSISTENRSVCGRTCEMNLGSMNNSSSSFLREEPLPGSYISI